MPRRTFAPSRTCARLESWAETWRAARRPDRHRPPPRLGIPLQIHRQPRIACHNRVELAHGLRPLVAPFDLKRHRVTARQRLQHRRPLAIQEVVVHPQSLYLTRLGLDWRTYESSLGV